MRWLLLLVVPACSFGARAAAAGDASIDTRGDAPGDTGEDASETLNCMARWIAHTVDFSDPVPLYGLNTTAYERDPFVSDDELTIYFSTTRADSLPLGGGDVYTAVRSGTGDPFGPASKFVPASSADGNEGKMSMTSDGTFLVVSSNHAGGQGGYDVWGASKTAATFGPLSETDLAGINDSNDVFDPFISGSGLHLYYAPGAPAPQHIVEATRATTAGTFGNAVTLSELSDPDGNGIADPALSYDERVIIFTSSRTGSLGGGDLWYATRASSTGVFSAPVRVPVIDTSYYEGDAHLSKDGCRLYFASTRNSGDDWDLFVAMQQ